MNDREERPEALAHGTAGVRRRSSVWLEGLRAALFLAPRWRGAGVSPWTLVLLALLYLAAVVGAGRLAIPGPATFQMAALGTGWTAMLFAVAACAFVARRRPSTAAGPDGTTLLAWLLVIDLLVSLPIVGLSLAMARGALQIPGDDAEFAQWGLFMVHLAWVFAAAVAMLVRQVPAPADRLGAVALLALQLAAVIVLPAEPTWVPRRAEIPSHIALPAALSASGVWPDMDDGAEEVEEAHARTVLLTQERLEAQSRVVVEALDGVQPQRPGITDLYAITFAPYADEDVFSRETAMVGGVMRDRFDAAGRVLNLQNHALTVDTVPWATPLNLERAIHRVAQRMDPSEDILFLHLTSHGGKDGRLAAGFEPLWVRPVTPKQLRRWLDDAGVRYAVISVSACFSGSWIKPLAAPGTLVMTAADATHTSYGCGRRSPLTFFGRAVFDEQLRKTRSFEAAFAAALPVIDQREKDAGKRDGPSNPQILVGAALRPKLAALVQRLESADPTPAPAPPVPLPPPAR